MKNCKICRVEFKPIRKTQLFCSNKCKFSDTEYNTSRSLKIKNPEKYLECKSTKKIIKDYYNLSGKVKSHLSKLNIEFDKQNYLNHFNIIDIPKKPIIKCPYCDWTTIDIENKSGIFTGHLKNKHNISIAEFIEKEQDNEIFKNYWKVFKRANNRNEFLKNKNNHIKCQICGEIFSILSNSHLKKHNLTQDEYKNKFKVETICSDQFIKQSRELLSQVQFSSRSKAENEIYEFLIANGIKENEIVLNNKKTIYPFELDFYIPARNLAIEYNGLYFHSELFGKNKNYHLNKTQLCENKNIHLIQIFSDEWINKKEIIKSRLKNILNITPETIYARKCNINVIDSKLKNEFLNNNHLQGEGKSKIYYGLFYENNLVSVMSFCYPRISLGSKQKTNDIWELSRFANKTNTTIIGGFSKLLKYFIKNNNPNKIYSYADKRFCYINKNVYMSNGFKLISTSPPSYFYTKDYNTKLHRFNFTKQSLVKKGLDSSKTEWELMQSLEYDRIWDCGHLKYELTF